MIKDSLNRAEKYFGLSDNIKLGLNWIKDNDLESMPDGRYEINDNIFANVQSYYTKDDAPYEAHRSYIDIQYMIKGEELSGVTDYANCTTVEEYDSDKDCEFLKCNIKEEFFRLKEKEFFIFFPHDAHKPALKINETKHVKKVIVKVRV
jgi:YhcH/YjgK/YiaL family protein